MWSSALTAISRAFLASNAAAQKTAAEKAAPQSTPTAPASQSVEVNLSPAGLARAALTGSANADIKQSGLPDPVQKALISLRDTQKRVAQSNTELQKTLNDKSLSPDMRQAKAAALQTVSAVYQRQISTSAGDLSNVMNALQLKSDDKAKASMLMLAKM
ncbi:chemotaxis protein [Pseudomonas sp. CDFA 553]|uniref:chemotaxis protein n=1 Tax=Pseudomonas quasicaspiana TaxID=2829821 RepID=UPI001E44E12A|nr:chemotaxis protein [Pseudomonas quasicaspiana]MCD5991481.1 chemotaxis protein [Pseudomonas quasicaspiana]